MILDKGFIIATVVGINQGIFDLDHRPDFQKSQKYIKTRAKKLAIT